MASPLSTFRQYDKVLLAVFGVLLMIAFLVEGMVLRGMRGNDAGGGTGDVVVSFKGGEIREASMANLRRSTGAVMELIQSIIRETQKKERQIQPFPRFQPIQTEQQLVMNVILARKAKDMGMTLSDADIDSLLRQYSDECLTDADLKRLREDVIDSYRGTVSEREIYLQLRTILLSQEVQAVLFSDAGRDMDPAVGSQHLTPLRAWDYFRRVNRKVKVEAVSLPVSAFIKDVKAEPTTAQIKELFEKYRMIAPNPAASEPGFAQPHKIGFGYIRIDHDHLLAEAMKTITEEEVKAEYDRRVAQGAFDVPDLPEEKKEEEGKKEVEKKDEQKGEADKPADVKPEEKTAPVKEEAKKEEAAKTADPAPEAKKTEEPAAKTEAPEAKKPAEKGAPGDKAEEGKAGTEGEKKEEAPAEKKADDKPVEEKPATDKPAVEGKAEEAEPADGDKKPMDKPKTRTRTLDEVREDLKKELARPKSEAARKEIVDAFTKEVNKYGESYRRWAEEKQLLEKEGKKVTEEKPGGLEDSLKELAKKYSVSLNRTEPLDQFGIASTELGQSFELTFMNQSLGRAEFAEIAYRPDFKMFEARGIRSSLANIEFIYWKEQDDPAKPLELKEAEPTVVEYWKSQKAYDLALEEGKKIADKAAGKTLREAFPEGIKDAGAIVETAEFSWLTSPAMAFGMGQQLEISRIPQVEYAGREFMETVHDLKPGEYGVCPDQPKKHIYVVRLIEEKPDEQTLRDRFMQMGPRQMNVASQFSQEKYEFVAGWTDAVAKDLNVQWHRNPLVIDR